MSIYGIDLVVDSRWAWCRLGSISEHAIRPATISAGPSEKTTS